MCSLHTEAANLLRKNYSQDFNSNVHVRFPTDSSQAVGSSHRKLSSINLCIRMINVISCDYYIYTQPEPSPWDVQGNPQCQINTEPS